MSITRFSTGVARDNLLAGNVSFAASDMELIGTIRVGSGGISTITFSNIPQEYKHLQIRGIARNTDSGQTLRYSTGQFNGVSSASYANQYLVGSGSATAGSSSYVSTSGIYIDYIPAGLAAASIFNGFIVDILDYSSALKNKTTKALIGVDLNGSGAMLFASGMFINTSAITSFSITPLTGNWAQYTRFSIYGIRG